MIATLAACGNSAEREPAQQQQPSSTSVSATPPAEYDISRVDNIKNDFPPGFTTEAKPTKTLNQHDIDSSGITAFTDAQIDPPQCRPVIIPPYAEPSVGTQAAGIRAQGDQGNMYVVALRSPKPVRASEPPAGCDQIALSGSPEATGTAERVPAPNIAGATTTGVKLSVNNPDEPPDYVYTAALDDQTSIVVMGSTDPDLKPQQMLSDLLVKATSAVRGR